MREKLDKEYLLYENIFASNFFSSKPYFSKLNSIYYFYSVINQYPILSTYNSISSSFLRSPHACIKESEPTDHYGELIHLLKSNNINIDKIFGLSYRDKKFIDQLKSESTTITYFDPSECHNKFPIKMESIEQFIGSTIFWNQIDASNPSLVLANRILHHASNLSVWVATIQELLNRNIAVLLEVPDAQIN